MIYRYATGAESGWKQKAAALSLILIITIGFPIAATLLTQEDFIPQPTNITQTDDPGAVLGENTQLTDGEGTTANATPASSPVASVRRLNKTSAPKAQPLAVNAAPVEPTALMPPADQPLPSNLIVIEPSLTPPLSDNNDSSAVPDAVPQTPTPSSSNEASVNLNVEVGPLKVDTGLHL